MALTLKEHAKTRLVRYMASSSFCREAKEPSISKKKFIIKNAPYARKSYLMRPSRIWASLIASSRSMERKQMGVSSLGEMGRVRRATISPMSQLRETQLTGFTCRSLFSE